MAKRLTWRREPRENGLAGVVQGERGYDLNYDGNLIAAVRPLTNFLNRWVVHGWYWVAGYGQGIPHQNTCYQPVSTMDEAKALCEAYVRKHLGLPEKKTTHSPSGGDEGTIRKEG